MIISLVALRGWRARLIRDRGRDISELKSTLFFLPCLEPRLSPTLPLTQSGSGTSNINAALQRVANGEATMNSAVGPAVGCLMATFGTNMISSCIFEFTDPEDLS
jgi:hypothetical protein